MQLRYPQNYLRGMNNKYRVLQVLASMVQDAPQPTQYQCIPRELILRLPFDWAEIYSALVELEKEGLVKMFQVDGITFSITEEGMANENALSAGRELYR